MWYFAWILGLPLAAAFAVLNAMWFELMEDEAVRHDKLDKPPARTESAASLLRCRQLRAVRRSAGP